MGKRGPKPTPTPVLQMRGSWRAQERAGEVAPVVGEPARPGWIHGDARAEWDRAVAQLSVLGLLSSVDGAVLGIYCQSHADCAAIQRCVAAAGGAHKADPKLVKQRDAAWQWLYRAAREFGMTPSARSGLKVSTGKENAKDAKSRFFSG